MDRRDAARGPFGSARSQRTLSARIAAVALAGLIVWTHPAPAAGERGRANRARTEILFQAFTWDSAVEGRKYIWYRHLKTKVDDLAAAGGTHVWLPPPARSLHPQGYMPQDWYDLGKGEALNESSQTLYGNEVELKGLIGSFHSRDVQCLADVVINHRYASHQENGLWNVFHYPSGKAVWEKWAVVSGDGFGGTGLADSGEGFGPAPDLDHSNPRVRQDVVDWLKWLRRTIGFDGWRFDYAKGYSPGYVKEYIQKSDPTFAVGEYWTDMDYDGSFMRPQQDRHRQSLCNWLDGTSGTSMAFDFTTKGLLNEAVGRGDYWRLKDGQGKAAGLIGWWKELSVTFVDNHDTGSTQAMWPFPSDKVLLGYAYILTHPGVPTIFWDHFYYWGAEHHDRIRDMARIRQDMGIHRGSQLEIVVAEQGRYVGRVDDKLMVALGNTSFDPGVGWRERLRGNGFVIWTRE